MVTAKGKFTETAVINLSGFYKGRVLDLVHARFNMGYNKRNEVI